MEEDLLFMNALHTAIQNVSLDGILVVNDTGEILSANTRFVEMWGIPDHVMAMGSNEKALAVALPQLVNPNEFVQSVNNLYQHKDQKSRQELYLKDGRVVDMYSAPVKEQEGKYYGRIWFFRDITKRKRAENALRQSEATLRSVFMATPVGLCIMEDRVFQSENKAWYDLFGYTETDLIGHTTHVLYENEKEYERVGRELSEGLYRSGFATVQTRLIRKDGILRDVILTAASLYAEALSSGRVVTIEDITDRKRAAEALQNSESRLRDILFSTADWIWEVDEKGVYTYSSQKGIEFFGNSRGDVIGKTPFDFMTQEESQRVAAIFSEAAANKSPIKDIENWNIGKNGEKVCLLTNAVPMLDEEGYLRGYRGIDKDITDRKRVEEALKYHNILLTTQLESSLDGILVVDDAGRMISLNQHFFELWDIPADVAESRSDERALQSVLDKLADPNGFLEKILYLYAHPDETSRDEIFLRDGRTFDRYSAPVIDTGGKYYGRIWQFRDITDHKQAQEALRKTEAAYREIFNAVNEAIFIHDLRTGEIMDVNNSMLEMYGYTRKEALRLSVEDYSSGQFPYTQENAIGLIAKTAGGESQVVEWRGRKKNGQTFPVEVSLKRGVIAGQERVLAVARDITERKQAEKALSASEQRLHDVIEFLPDATLIIDRHGKVIVWNRAIEAMTGVKKEDMLGKGDYEYALPFYGTRRPILIDLALHQDEAMEKQYTAMRRYDDLLFGEALTPNLPPGDIHLSATASVLRDYSGEIVAAIECIRDITERGRLEAQLRQAQKMEAIGTLAGGIAHDFNNILASMIGYTELTMMNDQRPDLRANYLGQVIQACERAKNLVNQILSFSRQREQQRKPVDVRLIVKEALKLLRASLPTTIQISPQIAVESLTVMADPTQIHQIVINLCTNAAHAMRDCGGVLDVAAAKLAVTDTMCTMHPDFKRGSYVHLMVRDSGHGIQPAILDKIFDPFFTTKRHQEGTGLGLSVVYGIVKSYNGVIQVQSDPGQGSTFNIYIPAIEVVKTMEESAPEETVHGGREAVLCVDDEEPLVRAMAEYLRNFGYDAIYATSSSDALAMVMEDAHRFDLIITDMTMPEMTGLQLSQKILSLNPETQIILCTGYNETITEAQAKENGIKEFVLKPVRLQEIARLVRELLDRP
ncbi:MAG: PAS domain S-box protein [Syntrophaceae bacterium]|nr:PAS domain S-box protein [Syntrophaceae bacterium]